MKRPPLATLLLWGAAVAAPLLAAGAARLAGGSWYAALASAAVAGVALYAASRKRTTDDNLADIGRGAIVGMILAFTAAWVDHEAAARSARENQEAEARSARESLALTLSSSGDFVGIDLHGKDLSRFYIGGKNFSNADFRNVRLEGAVLRGTKFQGANLQGARLARADLRDAVVSGPDTNLRRADLSRAILVKADLGGAALVDATLTGANLEGATLVGADLRGADLRRAILVGADLRLAFLVDADLRGAIFSADLRSARLTGAALAHARWDKTTRWPPGFDPSNPVSDATVRVPPDAPSDRVARIVDGDTLVLERLGGVRLLGINAPTSEFEPAECYGLGAKRTTQSLLPAGTAVRYVLGAEKQKDVFGRALAYLWLAKDASFINEQILERGAAKFLLSEKSPRYNAILRRAEIRAANERRGIWSSCGAPRR